MNLKKAALTGCLFLLLLGTAGCTKQEEEPVELTLMHGWGSTEDDHVAMRNIYMDYEKENPDVKLNLVSMPSGSELLRKVEDMLMVGDIPDLIFLGGTRKGVVYDFMVEKNLALNLMPYIEKDPELKKSLAPVNLNYWTTEKGELYTISDVLHLSGGYWYNKEIFAQVGIKRLPETWEEFLEVCKKIKSWSDREGKRVKCLQMPSEAYLYLMGHMLAAEQENTQEIMQNRSDSTFFGLKKLDKLLMQLKDLYSFTIAENDYSYRDDTSSFNKGKSAMFINGSWAAPMISPKIDAGYALLPFKKGTTLSCESACLGYVLGNTEDEKKREAAIDFVKYMLSKPVQERILRETEQMPANPEIDLGDYAEEMPRFYHAVEVVKEADCRIEVPDNLWPVHIQEIFTESIQDVLLGKKEETAFLRELSEAREK